MAQDQETECLLQNRGILARKASGLDSCLRSERPLFRVESPLPGDSYVVLVWVVYSNPRKHVITKTELHRSPQIKTNGPHGYDFA